MGWFKKIREKLNIRKIATGALALLVVLSLVFGIGTIVVARFIGLGLKS